MDPLFEIQFDIPARGSRDSSHRLYEQLKAAIREGRLPLGARLPATRQSRGFFGVSRNTAVVVYERLMMDGYVVSRQGSGFYIAETLPATPDPAEPITREPPGYRLNNIWIRSDITAALGFWRDPPTTPKLPHAAVPALDFRPALIDSRLFPLSIFRAVTSRQLRGLERRPATFKSPQGNQGNYHLRDAIIRHIALTRAVVCRPEDVLVTSGAQQAFDLLARVLVTPGVTVVALEDPGYPPLRAAFAAAGARVAPVAVDTEGLIVERLPDNVDVICVCPSHQFPLGVTMSATRRRCLLEFARRRGAVILEDDYDGEFRFEGGSLEALRTTSAAEIVFYVGTFSKCMLPALRLGFVIAPTWAMPTLVAAKNCLDWHSSIPVQTSVAGFIAEGHLARHVRKMREVYRRRRQLLLEILRNKFSNCLEPLPSFYGMHLAAVAPPDIDLEAVTTRLAQDNVKLHTLSRYYAGPEIQRGIIFGYGTVGIQDIKLGLSRIRNVLAT
jgi:GntR family transcriptional regulator/MocR family aminotransferase